MTTVKELRRRGSARGQNSPRFFVSGIHTILAEKPERAFCEHLFVKLHNGAKRHGKRHGCIQIA